MKGETKFESLEEWFGLSRDEKLKTLFECPPSWRRKQLQHLWGEEAYGYGKFANIPSTVEWNEIVKAITHGNCECRVKMVAKRDYISPMSRDEFHRLLDQEKADKKFCVVDPQYADRDFGAFNSWRNANFLGEKEYNFTVEKFDEGTLRFMLCIGEGSNGDDDGFGVEPDMWTSALFDLNGNIVRLFQPGIIASDD
jgi:hypothetical protein